MIGVIQLEYADWQKRPKATEIEHRILEETADLAGLQIEIRAAEAGPRKARMSRFSCGRFIPMHLMKPRPKS